MSSPPVRQAATPRWQRARVHVRDSEDRDSEDRDSEDRDSEDRDGSRLAFTDVKWAEFLAYARHLA